MSSHTRLKHRAYIALGSNLATSAGEPVATLGAAVLVLEQVLGSRPRASSLYETAPVGYKDQPVFVNGVVCVQTSLSPDELLQALLGVERAFGRNRGIVNGPRTLDLDLLMVDDLVLSTATLVLPHVRMAERRFVLAPMVEIAPELVHPVLGRTMADLLEALPDMGEQAVDGVRRLDGAQW